MPDLTGRSDFEKQLAAAVGDKLNGQLKDLVKYLGNPPSLDNVPVEFWDQNGKDLQDAIAPILSNVAQQAADVDNFDVSVTDAVDWGMIDQAAVDWAESYAFDLVKGIEQTSRDRISAALQGFFEHQGTMGSLRDDLEQIYSPLRAALIASTEVTRAAVNGELKAIEAIERDSNLKMVPTWQTNNDEHVCDDCDPRNGQTEDEWETDEKPPLHPMCRCWLTWAPEGW